MRRLVCVLVFATILVIMGTGLLALPVPGDHLQPFTLDSSDGANMTWKPGRTTVISFCAFWCDTWKEQSKRLARRSDAARQLPVDFITISVDGRWSERCQGKITGTLLLDLKSSLVRKLGINRIPCTLVIDPKGIVRYSAEGIVREAAVNEAVRSCIGGGTSDPGTVYLTFDDFPCAGESVSTTPAGDTDARLLDVLRTNDVQATFFCVCDRLSAMKSIVTRAVADGHSLQVHSWDHQADDPRVQKCVAEMRKTVGVTPRLYRAPGHEECEIISGGGFSGGPIVDPYDYTRPGNDELKRRILLAAKPGCVVLLHAGVSDTIEALPDVIRSLRQRGYRFDVLR